jgi:hypothetical protein
MFAACNRANPHKDNSMVMTALVGFFDDIAEAHRARDELGDIGIDRHSIQLTERATSARAEHGHVEMTVMIDDEIRVEEVSDVLEIASPYDVEQRAVNTAEKRPTLTLTSA